MGGALLSRGLSESKQSENPWEPGSTAGPAGYSCDGAACGRASRMTEVRAQSGRSCPLQQRDEEPDLERPPRLRASAVRRTLRISLSARSGHD
jgi:hypothetical protein